MAFFALSVALVLWPLFYPQISSALDMLFTWGDDYLVDDTPSHKQQTRLTPFFYSIWSTSYWTQQVCQIGGGSNKAWGDLLVGWQLRVYFCLVQKAGRASLVDTSEFYSICNHWQHSYGYKWLTTFLEVSCYISGTDESCLFLWGPFPQIFVVWLDGPLVTNSLFSRHSLSLCGAWAVASVGM